MDHHTIHNFNIRTALSSPTQCFISKLCVKNNIAVKALCTRQPQQKPQQIVAIQFTDTRCLLQSIKMLPGQTSEVMELDPQKQCLTILQNNHNLYNSERQVVCFLEDKAEGHPYSLAPVSDKTTISLHKS